MANIFVNATQARKNTRNNSVIHGEIRAVENVVLANVDAGVLYANISANTTMTTSSTYYNVYNSITTDPTKLDQINYVKEYFVDLGYAVSILTNSSSNNTITWNISW
jgi:hypothetical protein|tara:strand:- start:270 stop:590 length:321 start_codon:yes stop_codon:yes gene_type:complete